jgi:hypothetical protein
VKRSLILTLALSLAAALLSLPSAGAQNNAPAIVRGTTVQVTASTTPRRDRFRPYTFTTTGRVVPPGRYCTPGQNPGPGAANCVPVICPRGVTDGRYCTFPARNVICSGTVTVRFQKRGTTISSRNVFVRPDCTYRSRVTFHTLLRTRIGNLSVRARFQGNVVLTPRNSSTKIVRAG